MPRTERSWRSLFYELRSILDFICLYMMCPLMCLHINATAYGSDTEWVQSDCNVYFTLTMALCIVLASIRAAFELLALLVQYTKAFLCGEDTSVEVPVAPMPSVLPDEPMPPQNVEQIPVAPMPAVLPDEPVPPQNVEQIPRRASPTYLVAIRNKKSKETVYLNRGDELDGCLIDSDNGFPTILLDSTITYVFFESRFEITDTEYRVLYVNIDDSPGNRARPKDLLDYAEDYEEAESNITGKMWLNSQLLGKVSALIRLEGIETLIKCNKWRDFCDRLTKFFKEPAEEGKDLLVLLRPFFEEYQQLFDEDHSRLCHEAEAAGTAVDSGVQCVSVLMGLYLKREKRHAARMRNKVMAKRAGVHLE
jgi:hypothetical protein